MSSIPFQLQVGLLRQYRILIVRYLEEVPWHFLLIDHIVVQIICTYYSVYYAQALR